MAAISCEDSYINVIDEYVIQKASALQNREKSIKRREKRYYRFSASVFHCERGGILPLSRAGFCGVKPVPVSDKNRIDANVYFISC